MDHDLKGLAAWLQKHVRYAELEASADGASHWPAARAGTADCATARTRARWRGPSSKTSIFPSVPAKPVALFLFMYLIRLGLLDGKAGLHFCFYHAWYEASVSALQADTIESGM